MKRNWLIESVGFLAVFVLVFYVAWTIRGTYDLEGAIQYYPHYIYDSIPFEVPVEIEVEKPIEKPIPADIDSHAVALAYFSEYPFRFKGDTNEVKINAKGIISQNQILTLDVEVVNTRPTQLIYPKPKNEISAGLIMANKLLAPKLVYRHDRWSYGVGYDLIPDNQINLMLEVNYQIKSW
tara:strand:+ start:20229 stop:20768 length:540 start_codon:yes stop_codon:yes gene_type:complete